ncbi:phage tail termination protein [Streptomyces sp. 6N106]|uniref:phage tail termination protein n=1 Tax=Streptomyces sp. 6N106 TaxID=3457418 RepID=UPI003FD5ABDA
MSAHATPDLDGLVTDALRAANLGATVRVLMPDNPASELPLIVAHQVPGGSANRMGVVTGNVDVQVLAATRREASALARNAFAALDNACRNRFTIADGHLNRFVSVSGAPAELRTGTPDSGPSLFRFQGTCQITARANL